MLTASPTHTQEVDRWLFPGIPESDSAEQADKQLSETAAEDEARPDLATKATEKAIDYTSAKDDMSQDLEFEITRKVVDQPLGSAVSGNVACRTDIDSPKPSTGPWEIIGPDLDPSGTESVI